MYNPQRDVIQRRLVPVFNLDARERNVTISLSPREETKDKANGVKRITHKSSRRHVFVVSVR